MGATFTLSEEIDVVVKKLIEQEEDFKILSVAKIVTRFRTGTWYTRGKLIYAKTKILSMYERFEMDAEILILVNKRMWEHLTDQQKEALIFHELCHVEASVDKNGAPRNSPNDGRPVFRLCSHDLEEFKLVVEKYGLWRPDAQEFMDSAKKGEQLTMEFTPQNQKKEHTSNVIHLRAK
ncbi:putative metallopeptidase [Paenibacillus amylolyticus]|uniref:putative metallopeptidase n=1 Tax=Paenibacillus amylolyticus TaxID=1451 RepID=UPI003399560F